MKFTEHRDSQVYTVKQYQPGLVKINDFTLNHSCAISQHEIKEDWDCPDITSLNASHLDDLLAFSPEVILLGTGETQRFPDPALLAHCAAQGIGVEVMTNLAACRTYNVLTTEDREVVLALIISEDAD
ncbi:Mth938-like domain-containing protein [Thiomicrospira sp. WB1]|uniref:Mth938-like domain-containing protein n=1 Tax=Thiomicrospira sp. WB1 TaxID=1685380 RepID=UPI0007480DF0|nr:Mth938-like domain-containing protein [Thiomicrospira sp. WB1]KUJ72075.1 hypothetical protein AVO41_06465 [Thiomicrospira sp. WB1]